MKNTILAAVLGICSMASAQAAEKIRYEDLPLAPTPRQSVTVITIDGVKHKGTQIRIDADHVAVVDAHGCAENLPRGEITRIEIKRVRHFFDFTIASALAVAFGPELLCFEDTRRKCLAGAALVLAPIEAALAAFAVASAPVTLAGDGITWLFPAKVYEIIH
jgi:hypothetical protein